jgi:hypothetical protein
MGLGLAVSAIVLLSLAGRTAAEENPSGAASQPGSCQTANFETLRRLYITERGPVAASPATMILPAGGSSRLLFQQPMGAEAEARNFRVFEVDQLRLANMSGDELRVISTDPAPASNSGKYKPNDSVLLAVDIPAQLPLYTQRSFVVVACQGSAFSGWGKVTAPVSHPGVIWWICAGVGVLAYVLCMTAIFAQRRSPSRLAATYPAVFGARPLKWWDFINPIHLITNPLHEGSVQKAQVLLFSSIVGETVLSLLLRSGSLVDMSPTVVALLGISGIGAATSQITYLQRMRLRFDNWSWLQAKKALTLVPPPSAGPYWRDLFLTDRQFDVYKFQTIIFTAVVAFALVFAGPSHISDFSVPETLLGILGLSQVVYVGGILVKPPAVTDLDKEVDKLRVAGELVEAAKVKKTDIDERQQLLDALPKGRKIAANAERYRRELANTVATMIETALETHVDRKNFLRAVEEPEGEKSESTASGGDKSPPDWISAKPLNRKATGAELTS